MALRKSKKKLIRARQLCHKTRRRRLSRLTFKLELVLLVFILIGLNFYIAPDDPDMQKIITMFFCSIFVIYCGSRLFILMNCDN